MILAFGKFMPTGFWRLIHFVLSFTTMYIINWQWIFRCWVAFTYWNNIRRLHKFSSWDLNTVPCNIDAFDMNLNTQIMHMLLDRQPVTDIIATHLLIIGEASKRFNYKNNDSETRQRMQLSRHLEGWEPLELQSHIVSWQWAIRNQKSFHLLYCDFLSQVFFVTSVWIEYVTL